MSERDTLLNEKDPLIQLQKLIDIFENGKNVSKKNRLPAKTITKIEVSPLKKVLENMGDINTLETAAQFLLEAGGNICPELTFLDEKLKVEKITASQFAAHFAWEILDTLNYRVLQLKFPEQTNNKSKQK